MNNLRHTAIHETGHFLVAHQYGWVQDETIISVVPDKSNLGYVAQTKDPLKGQSNYENEPPEDVWNAGCQEIAEWYEQEERRTAWAREQALKVAVYCMGGAEACRVAGLPDPDEGADEDQHHAYEHLNHFLDALGEPQDADALISAMMELARVRARGIIGCYHRHGVLEACADALKEKRTMNSEQAVNVLREVSEARLKAKE